MSDPRNLRDPALGGDPALDPAGGRRRGAAGANGTWLIAVVVVAVVVALVWGWGGGFGRRAGTPDGAAPNNAAAGRDGAPVYGGAAPASAPMPAPSGNGSGR